MIELNRNINESKLRQKWCIAQIKPNSYNTAIQNLERQGFRFFLPKMEITQRKENKFVVNNVYVFPGYMFVCFDPHTISWTKINSTYGVLKILTFGNKSAEISSDLILELKNRYEINSKPTQKKKLQKGDSIKFYTGPFTDLLAKVERVDEKNRIWVLLEGMGGYQKLKLQSLEKNKYNKS
jgi:transcriptional antiterminator RfaH